MQLEVIKNSYLEHIKICIESDAWGAGLLRSFIDYWFAYHKQGAFLNSKNNPIWHNNPSPKKVKTPTCASCGSTNIDANMFKKYGSCKDCGHKWKILKFGLDGYGGGH